MLPIDITALIYCQDKDIRWITKGFVININILERITDC